MIGLLPLVSQVAADIAEGLRHQRDLQSAGAAARAMITVVALRYTRAIRRLPDAADPAEVLPSLSPA
jgi:hypothetical protein